MLVKEVGERGKWSSGVLAEVAEQAGASEIVLDQTWSFLLSTSRFLLDVLLDVLPKPTGCMHPAVELREERTQGIALCSADSR